jgi:hypothetical protein
MEVIDFARSFVTFVTPGRTNNARIQVDCACTLSAPGAAAKQYLLVASCKSEDVYVEDGLFKQPNYDFCGIFSEDEYAIIRAHATSDEGGYEIGTVAERFEALHIHVAHAEGRLCSSDEEIVRATLANAPLIARTKLRDPQSGLQAALEYPVKTMNVREDGHVYQVDTGPVVFPDLSPPGREGIRRLTLAFVAFNCAERAEFVLQVPTLVGAGTEVRTPHYSEVRKVTVKNEVVAVGD